MSGTSEGALRRRARQVGLSVSEYIDMLNKGMAWCYRDQAWEPASEFGRDASRSDGRDRSCRRSKNAAARRAYQPSARPPAGRRFVNPRSGDQKQARRRVNHLVNVGVLPNPNDVPCADCGHSGTGRRHEYDHHLGYEAEHHESVEAVCSRCHHAREAGRRAE